MFHIFPRGTQFEAGQPGLYVHVKETSPHKWLPLYIGQTGDLNDRLSNHEKEEEVNRAGATHVCARVNSGGEQARLDEEKDLIDRWQPECNVQHIRPAASPSTTRRVNPWQFSTPGQ